MIFPIATCLLTFHDPQIVDFAVWNVFRRQPTCSRPSHILCQGFQRTTVANNGVEVHPVPGLPGLYYTGENPYFDRLKAHPWNALPGLLGQRGDRILGELLVECGLFTSVTGSSNLQQLNGVPLSELKVLPKGTVLPPSDPGATNTNPHLKKRCTHGLSDIRLLHHRLLYAKPSLKASGNVRFGMSHVHVLNRYRDLDSDAEAMHVMKYIFPRQFGLHNVFTSTVDIRDTSQSFKDYTLREKEIVQARLRRKYRPGKPSLPPDKVPKRLRGEAVHLVRRLRKRHSVCPYRSVLEYYCPRTSSAFCDQVSTLGHATAAAQVAAFCKAVFRKVFPADFFDHLSGGGDNVASIIGSIDRFVHLRRFETLSLHDLMLSISVKDLAWLTPPKADSNTNMSGTDFAQRREIMAELLYYVFDSWLIPLIRSHFHVTESSTHRNQLFYFRHDVWKELSEPALSSLKDNMFEPCNAEQTKRSFSQNALGVSKVRLLPKELGMRPIINLRRRIQRQRHGGIVLGKSINSILTPTFSILNYEKSAHPELLGSALFSVDDMFARLRAFRAHLQDAGLAEAPLYFAKADVMSCFDTIPQTRLLQLADKIVTANKYRLTRYGRAKLVGSHSEETSAFGVKPSWKFLTKATIIGQKPFDLVDEIHEDAIGGRSRMAYIDGVTYRLEQRQNIVDLLHEHVESNIVKLGSRFYRQKEGIPQGSILSTLLCSYFYAELEQQVLSFTNNGNCLLLRLIDDFLVITTDREVAAQFVRTMHAGIPEFGVQVKPEKSRANFEMVIDGVQLPSLPAATDFPYCGNAINTITLDITKDVDRWKQSNVQDSVTVEHSKLPGQTFYRKCLNALKLHMRAMLLSTRYNAIDTVLANLYHAFSEIAQKTYHYIRSMPVRKQPNDNLLISKYSSNPAPPPCSANTCSWWMVGIARSSLGDEAARQIFHQCSNELHALLAPRSCIVHAFEPDS